MTQTIDVNNRKIDVEQFRDDWALGLMTCGVIVKLCVGRWRALAQLTPEMLGLKFINEDGFDFCNRYLELGRQKLLPPEVLNEIETLERRSRNILSLYSFDTVWGRFVPFTAFADWERENAVVRENFLRQAEALGNQYDSIVAAVKSEYRIMARDVWMRLYPKDEGGPTSAFVEDFVSKVISKIPSREEIVKSFQYSATYFVIPMPSFVADNIAKVEQIKRQEEIAKFETDLEKQTKRRISEEYIKRKKELIDGFLESTVSSMRKYVSELCDAVLISMARKGKNKVTTSQVNRLKEMIKKVRLLNFYDDKEVSALLKDLDAELDKVKGDMNQQTIAEKLKAIVDVGKKEYMPSNFNPLISILEV
jgi:hypothetical protein